MFTGIIESVGEIKSIDGSRFVISHNYKEPFDLGESIALNGMCSTVVGTNYEDFVDSDQSTQSTPLVPPFPQKGALHSPPFRGPHQKTLEVDIIQESRKLTTFGTAKIGDVVNLERAARVGQRNSGHNLTGHIDEVGTIIGLDFVEDFYLVRVTINPAHRVWLVHKGSVALEGISLTVSGVSPLNQSPSSSPQPGEGKTEAWFEVSIIPHTWAHTTLKSRTIGEGVNVEFDILGKYALNQV